MDSLLRREQGVSRPLELFLADLPAREPRAQDLERVLSRAAVPAPGDDQPDHPEEGDDPHAHPDPAAEGHPPAVHHQKPPWPDAANPARMRLGAGSRRVHGGGSKLPSRSCQRAGGGSNSLPRRSARTTRRAPAPRATNTRAAHSATSSGERSRGVIASPVSLPVPAGGCPAAAVMAKSAVSVSSPIAWNVYVPGGR